MTGVSSGLVMCVSMCVCVGMLFVSACHRWFLFAVFKRDPFAIKPPSGWRPRMACGTMIRGRCDTGQTSDFCNGWSGFFFLSAFCRCYATRHSVLTRYRHILSDIGSQFNTDWWVLWCFHRLGYWFVFHSYSVPFNAFFLGFGRTNSYAKIKATYTCNLDLFFEEKFSVSWPPWKLDHLTLG